MGRTIISHCVLDCMFISVNHKRNEKSVMLYNCKVSVYSFMLRGIEVIVK